MQAFLILLLRWELECVFQRKIMKCLRPGWLGQKVCCERRWVETICYSSLFLVSSPFCLGWADSCRSYWLTIKSCSLWIFSIERGCVASERIHQPLGKHHLSETLRFFILLYCLLTYSLEIHQRTFSKSSENICGCPSSYKSINAMVGGWIW